MNNFHMKWIDTHIPPQYNIIYALPKEQESRISVAWEKKSQQMRHLGKFKHGVPTLKCLLEMNWCIWEIQRLPSDLSKRKFWFQMTVYEPLWVCSNNYVEHQPINSCTTDTSLLIVSINNTHCNWWVIIPRAIEPRLNREIEGIHGFVLQGDDRKHEGLPMSNKGNSRGVGVRDGKVLHTK